MHSLPNYRVYSYGPVYKPILWYFYPCLFIVLEVHAYKTIFFVFNEGNLRAIE